MQNHARSREMPEGPYPDCLGFLEDVDEREVAREILEILDSASFLVPKTARTHIDPKNFKFQGRIGAFIIRSIFEGRKLKNIEQFESDKIKFLGAAAGAIYAIVNGALGPFEEEAAIKMLSKLKVSGDIAPIKKEIFRIPMKISNNGERIALQWQKQCGIWVQTAVGAPHLQVLTFRFLPVEFC